MSQSESLIAFPCEFPIKVFGESCAEFLPTVLAIVQGHDASFSADKIASKNSKTARYVSLTCNVYATSKAQLDAIYRDLSADPRVKMAL